MFESSPGDAISSNIAAAPGDLPLQDVIRRVKAQRSQFRHDNTLRPLGPVPDRPAEVWATAGARMDLQEATVWYTTDGSAPRTGCPQRPMDVVDVVWDPLAGYFTRWRAEIPALPEGTVVRYRIGGWSRATERREAPDVWAQDGQGFWFQLPADAGITTFAYTVEPAGSPLPDWVRDAVVYHIFLDRFHPGTPDGRWQHGGGARAMHGGTLNGVRWALPYLGDLGVTCLWLSPLYPAPSYHRYDATDFYAIDPALGTEGDLRDLVDEAHRREMRVILDFVPAHASHQHPAFRSAQESETAPTASWFTFERRPDRYRMFLGAVSSLPSINTQDHDARAHLIGSAVHWLTRFGVDGFRVDHAIGAGMDFYVALRTAMRSVKAESFTVGEVTDSPDCLRRYRNRLDAVLDFPLASALRLTFARGEWSLEAFDAFLTAYERYMASGPGRLSFLDNHDMNRFLFLADNQLQRLKLAALCQFTLAPTPVVYYGTEIALRQEGDIEAEGFEGDAEVRRDMPWDAGEWDQDLLAFYRSLVSLRLAHRALRDGSRHTVHVDGRRNTYAYIRSADGEKVLVALNLGGESLEIPLVHVPGPWKPELGTGGEARWAPDRLVLPPGAGIVARSVSGS